MPNLPAVNKRHWLGKQTMLCAMNFMLAAEAAGLNTLPMEGFDTARVRSALQLPSSWEPMLIVPVGHAPARHLPPKNPAADRAPDPPPLRPMNKPAIVQAILSALRDEFEARQAASRRTRAGGNDAESKSEGKYDTRSIEENYLADGLAKLAADAAQAAAAYEKLALRDFEPGEPIDLGALVEIEFPGATEWFFLGARRRGHRGRIRRSLDHHPHARVSARLPASRPPGRRPHHARRRPAFAPCGKRFLAPSSRVMLDRRSCAS